jgi:hypothetical protein
MQLYTQNFIAGSYFHFWLRNIYCTLDQSLADCQFGHVDLTVVSADSQCNLLSYVVTVTRNSIVSRKKFVILHLEPAEWLLCMRLRKRNEEIEKKLPSKTFCFPPKLAKTTITRFQWQNAGISRWEHILGTITLTNLTYINCQN